MATLTFWNLVAGIIERDKMKKHKCKKWDDWVSRFGNIKVLISHKNTATYGLAKEVWDFKYCPFCSRRLEKT